MYFVLRLPEEVFYGTCEKSTITFIQTSSLFEFRKDGLCSVLTLSYISRLKIRDSEIGLAIRLLSSFYCSIAVYYLRAKNSSNYTLVEVTYCEGALTVQGSSSPARLVQG